MAISSGLGLPSTPSTRLKDLMNLLGIHMGCPHFDAISAFRAYLFSTLPFEPPSYWSQHRHPHLHTSNHLFAFALHTCWGLVQGETKAALSPQLKVLCSFPILFLRLCGETSCFDCSVLIPHEHSMESGIPPVEMCCMLSVWTFMFRQLGAFT
ncbi:hypothetical protein JAAARDRAFT_224572 [Jaapia argillacea MUCL 33604]|uniref:Uncharacterized protein n=1 Tax=Jaapia argillacea MUCL 33604 TaxID=933084 RepID=A0A067QE08_9AGAM|nr:hypothetical protein JAAARDRAFT_224572 [Jaapia argillacea MUCL 33604]